MDMDPRLPNRLLNGSPPQIRPLLRGILLPHPVMIRIRFQHWKEVFPVHYRVISKAQKRALCVNHPVSPVCLALHHITPFASPAVFEDWLATVDLRGTQIIVRISGFTLQDGRGSAICDGNIASTTGKLIQTSGTSPEIEVKAMVPGARPMSIPLRFVKPVHPGGRPEEAIIFAGEYSGAVGVVGHAFGPSWEVVVFDDQDCMYFVEVPPEYMVRTVKRTIRLGGCSS